MGDRAVIALVKISSRGDHFEREIDRDYRQVLRWLLTTISQLEAAPASRGLERRGAFGYVLLCGMGEQGRRGWHSVGRALRTRARFAAWVVRALLAHPSLIDS